MALGASIRGFRQCMRPMIAVDGTFLKGKCWGTMFVATAQDGNEQAYPITFGYEDSENNTSWEWFLDCLKGALSYIKDLVLISDQRASIEAGIASVFPHATHTICDWHFSENIKKRFHIKDVTGLMFAAAKKYQELQYNHYMGELRNLHQNKYNYVINAGPEKWSNVHCPQRRYRLLTTNVAECLNLCMRFARKLPMLTLDEFIRDMLQRWYYDRHQAALSMRYQLTNAAQLMISKCIQKCSFMIVSHVDWNTFLVKLKGDQWTVNLLQKTCTCNKFQMDYLPCSHALPAAR